MRNYNSYVCAICKNPLPNGSKCQDDCQYCKIPKIVLDNKIIFLTNVYEKDQNIINDLLRYNLGSFVGPPKATAQHSSEELKNIGLIGIYKTKGEKDDNS